jgi:integrase
VVGVLSVASVDPNRQEVVKMPSTQRGQAYKLRSGRWGLRYYDAQGARQRKSPFPSKSAALAYYRDVVELGLRGEPSAKPDLTFAEFAASYIERHAADVRPRTIATLTERLRHAERRFGDVTLHELERMVDEIAGWQAKQPSGIRYGRVQALRQTLEAAVRWGYMHTNPAKLAGRNRQPAPRPVRAFTRAEPDAIAAELSLAYAPLPAFAAATGLRPEEWQALERRDVDRRAGVLNVRRTVSSGEVVELGKTKRSRRQVPLSPRALQAIDALPPRLDTPLLFPAPGDRRAQPQQLPQPCLDAGDRGQRRAQARQDLRPSLDVRVERACGRHHGVRAGPSHGHKRRHDRAPLRRAARRIRGEHGEPPGRVRGRAGSGWGPGQD